MVGSEPKYITFDCYGTLIAFGMSAVTRELLTDRVPGDRMEDFLDDFEAHRLDEQIRNNVDKLGAPFHAVYTAEQAQAYKPRFRAFEYMLDQLGCTPQDVLHVSSSLRYDLMPAHDLRITNKVYANRGYEPTNPSYGYQEVKDFSGLPPFHQP